MSPAEALRHVHKLSSDVVNCIGNKDFDGMKAGILATKAFLDASLQDRTISQDQYKELCDAVMQRVYSTLSR